MCQTVITLENHLYHLYQLADFLNRLLSRINSVWRVWERGKRHILPSLGSLSKIKQVVNCDERWRLSAARDSWDKTRGKVLHSRLTPGQLGGKSVK